MDERLKVSVLMLAGLLTMVFAPLLWSWPGMMVMNYGKTTSLLGVNSVPLWAHVVGTVLNVAWVVALTSGATKLLC